MKPVIGLIPLVDDERESLWMLPGYMDGLTEAGALPLMLPLTDDPLSLRQLCALCDGFLLTGGHDVSPEVYDSPRLPVCGACSSMRDRMERIVLDYALEKNLPILGICRGIQFMNAALGGTLYQDLPTQHPSETDHHQTPPYDTPAHEVSILADTPLHNLLHISTLSVNSYHHQAVCDLAPVLSPMALSPDNLIEAVWMPDKRFVWGIQWHPEFAYKSRPDCKAIFDAFVDACQI